MISIDRGKLRELVRELVREELELAEHRNHVHIQNFNVHADDSSVAAERVGTVNIETPVDRTWLERDVARGITGWGW